MNLNTKYIFLGILSLFLLLTSVCVFASDNATCSLNEVPDSSLNIPVPTDEPVNIEKETPQKNIDKTEYLKSDENHNTSNTELNYQNETVINHSNTDELSKSHISYLNNQSKCIFAGEEITVEPIINSTIMDGHSSGILKGNIVYSSVYDNTTKQFILYFTKEIAKGIVYEKIYWFENITNTNEIYTMLENKQYTPAITLSRNYDINSQEDYINALTSDTPELFKAIEGNIVNEEIENEMTRCKETNIQCTFNRCLNVNFKKTLDFECSSTWQFPNGLDIININGNASRIYSKFDDSEEFVFAKVCAGKILTVSNLTIAGFNHAIVNNKGTCIFNNVTFDNNKMDYWFKKDYGAGIYNEGLCICNNCTFSNNYCKYGAGIYSTGTLYLNNNNFIGNCAYGKGSDVAVDDGTVYLDGKKVEENNPQITFTHTAIRTLVKILTAVCACTLIVGGIVAIVGISLSLPLCVTVGELILIAGLLMTLQIITIDNSVDLS